MPSLIRHELSPSPAALSLDARAAFTVEGGLALNYRLAGNTDALILPAATAPERVEGERVEGLWRHTCFEVFVMGEDAPAYREFNFSPSGAWQAYGFQAYRQGGPLARAVAPGIDRLDDAGFGLDVLLPASQLPPGARLRLGLSAVLESLDGSLSYWALRHPPGRPDFHHSDCFALELVRP